MLKFNRTCARINSLPKIDLNTGRAYNYSRLCESYRPGSKVRHRTMLSLGNLPLYPTPVVEALAHRYYNQIIDGRLVARVPGVSEPKNVETVDLDSVEIENARESGSEWMCYNQ